MAQKNFCRKIGKEPQISMASSVSTWFLRSRRNSNPANRFDTPDQSSPNQFDTSVRSSPNQFGTPSQSSPNQVDGSIQSSCNRFDTPIQSSCNRFEPPIQTGMSYPNQFDSSSSYRAVNRFDATGFTAIAATPVPCFTARRSILEEEELESGVLREVSTSIGKNEKQNREIVKFEQGKI